MVAGAALMAVMVPVGAGHVGAGAAGPHDERQSVAPRPVMVATPL